MSEPSRKIIGRNVKLVRRLLNQSQSHFGDMVDLSKPTIINIESGQSGYNIDLLESIISFTGYILTDFANSDFKPEPALREKLIEKYQNDSRYSTLGKKPNIVYAIKYKLMVSSFFENFRETNEIKKYFEQFGWYFKGPSITNALRRLSDEIDIREHPDKNNTHQYRRSTKQPK